jgi:hypothetical protein
MIPGFTHVELDDLAHNDFPNIIELYIGFSEKDIRRYELERDRAALRFSMSNNSHSFIDSLHHYTRKSTLTTMFDYLKTYIKK